MEVFPVLVLPRKHRIHLSSGVSTVKWDTIYYKDHELQSKGNWILGLRTFANRLKGATLSGTVEN